MHTGDAIVTFGRRALDPAALVARKKGQRISVCIPARDEEKTVGAVVEVVHGLVACGLVDELVVIDDGSLDTTGAVAAAAGARVVTSSSARAAPLALGKGGALRRGVAVTSGEILVFLDADVTNFAPHFVLGLVAPLLEQPEIDFVKGFYARAFEGAPTGGGRVTELLARPLLAQFFPELAGVFQPLAGESALRRHLLEHIALDDGYGVEMGILVDVACQRGPGAIAQVDLGERAHRNRPLDELVPQAHAVLAAALERVREGVA